MEGTTKNIIIVLATLTFAFAGYYFYVQYSASDMNESANGQDVQNMLARTQVFIDRSQELQGITLDLSLFEDPRFKSLKSFTTPIKEQSAGRSNPFAEVGSFDINSSPQ